MTDTVSETEVSFEVWQDGDMVAAADSLADAEHFMLVYGQDGPVEAKTAITTRFPGFNVDTAMLAGSPQGEGSSGEATPHERLAKALADRDMDTALRLIGEMNEAPAEPQWIKHDGGPNPVPELRSQMSVRLKSGREERAFSDDFRWDHKGWDTDIIAYRVTEGVKP